MMKRIYVFAATALFFIIPLTGTIIVKNEKELQDAVLQANQGGDREILLADGTYTLTDMLWISADGVTVRSQSGDREKVTIRGAGMYGGVSHIFNVAGTRFTAKDMTIGWVSNHAIQIHGNNNSGDTLISNLHIVDTYEQMVKISYDPASPNTSKNGIMEYCLLEYSAGIGPQYYIGGIDGHQTRGWTVRNNVFKNIISPGGDIAEHAVHFWSGSENTIVENNLIINCDRGIGFGLGERGHKGGIIRNNMIVHTSSHTTFADVGIGLENASAAQVYNNTVFLSHAYPNAIEYRFTGTAGGFIINNLTNRSISRRDGASADVKRNLTGAQTGWFVDVAAADLHLKSPVPEVVDKGLDIQGLEADFDGDSRPQGKGIDIGADEYTTDISGPESPKNFAAVKRENRSLLLVEYMINLTWEPPAVTEDIHAYRLYQVENNRLALIRETPPATLSYLMRRVERDKTYRFAATSVDGQGNESKPVYTEVN